MGVVLDPSDFARVLGDTSRFFDVGAEFPAQVLRDAGHPKLFGDANDVTLERFWPKLQELASLHGDDTLSLVTLKPNPLEYYRPEYGYFAAAEFSIAASYQEWVEARFYAPGGDETGAIEFSHEIYAITGPSAAWGCWVEHAPGLALFAARCAKTLESWARGLDFVDVHGALQDLLPGTFVGFTVPPDYSRRLLENYG